MTQREVPADIELTTMLTQAAIATRADSLLPRLDRWLRRAVLVGLALVLLFPLARGQIPWLGWAPLWLVGMPLAAWWALHRFRLPWPRRAGQRAARARAHRLAAVAHTGWAPLA